MKKTNMKKYVISLGSVAMLAMPVVAAVSCSTTDSPYEPGANGVSLNNISGTLAHSLFRGNGALKVGDKLSLNVGGKVYVITWTDKDAAAEASAEPAELFELIVSDFLALPNAPLRSDIVAALGTSASTAGHHGATVSSVSLSGIDFTGKAGNSDFWHTNFRLGSSSHGTFGPENIRAGQKLSLVVNNKEIVYTWTAEDVLNENELGPDQLIEYVGNKFVEAGRAQNISKEDVLLAFGSTADGHHSYPHHAGTQNDPIHLEGLFTRGAMKGSVTMWHDLFRREEGYLYDSYSPEVQAKAAGTDHGHPTPAVEHRDASMTGAKWLTIQLPSNLHTTAPIVSFQWTIADEVNEAKLTQDQLFDYLSARLLGVGQADAYAFAKNNAIVPATPATFAVDVEVVRMAMAIDGGGHHNVNGPAYIYEGQEIGDGTPEQRATAIDFNNKAADSGFWHTNFRFDPVKGYGGENIGAGTIIKLSGVDVNGQIFTIYSTWTKEDVAAEANLGPEALIEYVTQKFIKTAADAKMGITAQAVEKAIGTEKPSHHTYPSWAVTEGTPVDHTTYNLNAPMARSTTANDVANPLKWSANTTLWHDLFRTTMIEEGDVLSIIVDAVRTVETTEAGPDGHKGDDTSTPDVDESLDDVKVPASISGSIVKSFTWTSADVTNEGKLNQDDLFDYLAARLNGATEVESLAYAQRGVVPTGEDKADIDKIRAQFGVDTIAHHAVGNH